MTQSLTWLPAPTPDGASRCGNSYLKQWVACPREWFNLYLRPTILDGTQGTGITPRHRALNLNSGSLIHEMIAAWYASGSRNGEDSGEYDIDRAIAAGEVWHTANAWSYLDEAEASQDLANAIEVMRSYHDWYGPQGWRRDYPTLKVVHDAAGEPVVEREFTMDLGYGGYVYTCRADLVVEHHGYLKVMEHKTSAPSWVSRRIRSIHMDSQFTGEVLTLTTNFPEAPLFGVLVNVIVKGHTANSKFSLAERETTNRTPEQLQAFRLECVNILQQIDDAVGGFQESIGTYGLDVETAADRWFPRHGTRNDHCYSYNRQCDYMELCQKPGNLDAVLQGMRLRTRDELTAGKERTL